MKWNILNCPFCEFYFLTNADLNSHLKICILKPKIIKNIKEEYKTDRWRIFREMIFRRDEYKCVRCNEKTELQPHHIKRVTLYPSLFYDPSNVITLCRKCHETNHINAQSRYIYDQEGFFGSNPEDIILCDCGNFYHEAKYKMCYNCYLEMKKEEELYL